MAPAMRGDMLMFDVGRWRGLGGVLRSRGYRTRTEILLSRHSACTTSTLFLVSALRVYLTNRDKFMLYCTEVY